MNKVDKLIERARPKPTIIDRLEKDNPWLGMSLGDLVDMMSADHYTAPEMGRDSLEWGKFTYALAEAYHREAEA